MAVILVTVVVVFTGYNGRLLRHIFLHTSRGYERSTILFLTVCCLLPAVLLMYASGEVTRWIAVRVVGRTLRLTGG